MVELSRWVRAGVWMLPVFGLLTFFATLTHQPDPATRFEEWSRYVTTDVFLASHIVGSIAGAAFAILGVVALGAFLAGSRRSGLAAAGMAAAVFGNVLVTAVFGIAAGAQPALGRAFLAGEPLAEELYSEVYGPPVFGIAGAGVILFSLGFVLLGWAAAASGRVPAWAGAGMAVAGPLIGLAGVIFGPAQTPGSILMIVAGLAIAKAVGASSSGDEVR